MDSIVAAQERALDPQNLMRRIQPMAAPLPLPEEQPGLLGGPQDADTFGWDTVFAVSFVEANTAIRTAHSSPKTLEFSKQDGDQHYQLEGQFDHWQLNVGGDGKNIRFNVPLTTLSVTMGGQTKTYDHVRASVVFTMGFVKNEAPQKLTLSSALADGQGDWLDLKVDASQPASVTQLYFDGSVKPGDIEQMIIRGLLEQWFLEPGCLTQFDHVFGSINLNARAAKADFQWLMPTAVNYAVVDRGSLDRSVLAITCMTENRTPPDSGHQVSPFAIPEAHSSGFLISQERFLTKLLMPGIGEFFSGPVKKLKGKVWPQDYFAIDPKEGCITNLTGVYIDKMQVGESEKDVYRAEIGAGNFNLSLRSASLQTEIIDLHHEYNHFITWLNVYHTIRSNSTVMLDGDTFSLAEGNGTHHVVVTKDKTSEWIEIGLLTASLVAIGISAAAKGWVSASTKIASKTATTASVTTEVVATAAPTAAQSSSFFATGANAILSAAKTGILNGGEFLTAWKVVSRAALIGSMAGAGWAVMRIIDVLADIDAQENALPSFNAFAATVMAPVQWPSQGSGYQVDFAELNGVFQVAGHFVEEAEQ